MPYSERSSFGVPDSTLSVISKVKVSGEGIATPSLLVFTWMPNVPVTGGSSASAAVGSIVSTITRLSRMLQNLLAVFAFGLLVFMLFHLLFFLNISR